MTADLDPDPSQITYPGSAPTITENISRDQNAVNHRGWRRVVLGFTPSWFTVTMGTGITSILLHNLPYNGRWLYWISVVIFSLNILLFVSFLCISVVRYTMFKELWSETMRNPAQAVFLGIVPFQTRRILTDMFKARSPWDFQPSLT